MDNTNPRDALAHERNRAEDRVAALTRELGEIIASAQLANIDDEHDPDGSTIAYERAKVTALLATAERDIVAIDDALDRTRTSSYGTCASCGDAIGSERLRALPATTTCVACAGR